MDVDPGQYFAIMAETFNLALFPIADRLGCPQQRSCNGLILFGCVATGNRAIVAVYRESNLDHDSPRKPKVGAHCLRLDGGNITPVPNGNKLDWPAKPGARNLKRRNRLKCPLSLVAYQALSKTSPVSADEPNFLAGADVYKQHCAACHGLPGQPPTDYAATMYPKPTQLFRSQGVTDDPALENYWKVANGIRMSGMPAFKTKLTDTQLWQVSQLVAHANESPNP